MRVFLAFVVAIFLCAFARAQNVEVACGAFDTNISGTTTPMAALGVCNITTGPTGNVVLIDNSQVTCTAATSVQFYIAPGTSPVAGSNILGHASGGNLTVESVIPGLGASPWLIQTGQLLSSQGLPTFTPTAITGQTSQANVSNSSLSWDNVTKQVTVTTSSAHPFTPGNDVIIAGVTPSAYNGTRNITSSADNTHFTFTLLSDPGTETVPGTSTAVPGGVGVYTIADSSLTISAGTNLYSLNALPGGMTSMAPAQSQTACNGGGFILSTPVGVFNGSPRTAYWIGMAISTSTTNSSAAWNNNAWTILTP